MFGCLTVYCANLAKVTFRYRHANMLCEALNEMNESIQVLLQFSTADILGRRSISRTNAEPSFR